MGAARRRAGRERPCRYPTTNQDDRPQSAAVAPVAGLGRAMPTGPVAGTKLTPAYAALVARDAYVWAWPLVNVYNRRLAYAPVTEVVKAGPVPSAPLNQARHAHRLRRSGAAARRLPQSGRGLRRRVARPRLSPLVLQVPDFGDRFWVYQDGRPAHRQLRHSRAMYGTTPASTCWSGRTGRDQVPKGITKRLPRYDQHRLVVGRASFRTTPPRTGGRSRRSCAGHDVSAVGIRRQDEEQGLERASHRTVAASGEERDAMGVSGEVLR